eukprot:c17911_g1_i1.p1 GENE.c17911_g1_i1~~c17911_g1_i1.p1  ORF type:complete len:338 (+),score=35.25 c17911_g1_i1:29-1042(+)
MCQTYDCEELFQLAHNLLRLHGRRARLELSGRRLPSAMENALGFDLNHLLVFLLAMPSLVNDRLALGGEVVCGVSVVVYGQDESDPADDLSRPPLLSDIRLRSALLIELAAPACFFPAASTRLLTGCVCLDASGLTAGDPAGPFFHGLLAVFSNGVQFAVELKRRSISGMPCYRLYPLAIAALRIFCAYNTKISSPVTTTALSMAAADGVVRWGLDQSFATRRFLEGVLPIMWPSIVSRNPCHEKNSFGELADLSYALFGNDIRDCFFHLASASDARTRAFLDSVESEVKAYLDCAASLTLGAESLWFLERGAACVVPYCEINAARAGRDADQRRAL